jgi:hypothetical protein
MLLIYTHILQIIIDYMFETQIICPQCSSLAGPRNDSKSSMYIYFRKTLHASLTFVATPCFHGHCKVSITPYSMQGILQCPWKQGVATNVREACKVFLKYMYMDDLESFLGPAKLLHCGQII